eukprot:11046735-Karenia_brevis.AAC.1
MTMLMMMMMTRISMMMMMMMMMVLTTCLDLPMCVILRRVAARVARHAPRRTHSSGHTKARLGKSCQ